MCTNILYHDPVVQTGETCCASDMTEYENLRIKQQQSDDIESLPERRPQSVPVCRHHCVWLPGLDDNTLKALTWLDFYERHAHATFNHNARGENKLVIHYNFLRLNGSNKEGEILIAHNGSNSLPHKSEPDALFIQPTVLAGC